MKISLILLLFLGAMGSYAESLHSENIDLEEKFSNACGRFDGDSSKLFAFKPEDRAIFLDSENNSLVKTRAIVEFEITPGVETELMKIPDIEPSDYSSRIEYRQALIDRQTKVAMIKYGKSLELLENLDLTVNFGPMTERAIISGNFENICEVTKIVTVKEIILDSVFQVDIEG